MTQLQSVETIQFNQEDNLEAFELFAEELPEQTDFAIPSTLACFSTGACTCAFSTAGTLSTKACPD
jgi:hypothetical protein